MPAGEEISTVFGVPVQALFGQVLIGLINGAFYAMLSLGLSVIFGLLNIIHFAHGALYMTGAFAAYFLLQWAGLGYWWSLLLAPIAVGLLGVVLEKTMLKRLYHLDHLYGLLLTFGIALIIQGGFRNEFGSSGLPAGIEAGRLEVDPGWLDTDVDGWAAFVAGFCAASTRPICFFSSSTVCSSCLTRCKCARLRQP